MSDALAAALALVLTSTQAAPPEPRQLTPRERAIYRIGVSWQEQARTERAKRKSAEDELDDCADDLKDAEASLEGATEGFELSTVIIVAGAALALGFAGGVVAVVAAGSSP